MEQIQISREAAGVLAAAAAEAAHDDDDIEY